MFKSTIIATVAVAALAFGATAHAEAGKYYAGVGVAQVNVQDTTKFNDIDFNGGTQINKYFAVEAEAEFGLNKKISGVDVKVSNLAAYVVGLLPLSPSFDLTGRVGYGQSKITGSSGSASYSLDKSGASYGVGLRYFPKGGANGVRVDLTRYDLGKNNGNADSIQIAYVHKF